MEIQTRINLASGAFGRLRTRVLLNNDIKHGTTTVVYLAVCISTLLYASETWTPNKRHIQMLKNFHTRCLERIFGISWEDRVTREELYRRSNTTSIEAMPTKRHLRWLGHVIKMPDHRLPRQILYGKLSHGNCSAGGQKKRYKDLSKTLFKFCNIQLNSQEQLASDRSLWRSTSHRGAETLETSLNQKRATKRAQRH
ncbi:hypothetical protein Hamer_G002114 [Homarus americanus]|uniref:Uncharacterized protein n=1 Tax=Homarus americanus TaxID=6706 RepID=A0A8J5JVL7_HOMAM|nr:hypothetical protein Hamer_G002114 [Homarus americanus]